MSAAQEAELPLHLMLRARKKINTFLPKTSTGNMKLQHFGVFVAVWMLEVQGIGVTLSVLSEALAIDRMILSKMTQRLVEAKVLDRSRDVVVESRGQKPYLFRVHASLLRRRTSPQTAT